MVSQSYSLRKMKTKWLKIIDTRTPPKMQESTTPFLKLDFKTQLSLIKFDAKPFDSFTFDHTLASDPEKHGGLIRFVCTYYNQNYAGWKLEDYNKSWDNYQMMIGVAIKSNNILGLEILWKGIYYHDRSNPDFVTDVYTAVECADLRTVLHVLHGYMI